MPRFLVTGGAGFIGCNYAHRLLVRADHLPRVTVLEVEPQDLLRVRGRVIKVRLTAELTAILAADAPLVALPEQLETLLDAMDSPTR